MEIGARGDGIGFADGDADQPVFIPYTVPDDVVDAELHGNRGRVVSIITEGDARAPAPCGHFGECGGCALQHVAPPFYKDWKHKLVVAALAREGFDERIVAPAIYCAPASRRRAAFAVKKTKDGVAFGFSRRQAHIIQDINECHILHPSLLEKLPALRRFSIATAGHFRNFMLMTTLCDNGVDVVISGDVDIDDLKGAAFAALSDAAREAGLLRVSVGDAPLVSFGEPQMSFGAMTIAPPPGGFLQASAEGEAALVKLVRGAAGHAVHIADLFCGAGTFTGPLNACGAVDGFDADTGAIGALDAAIRNGAHAHPVRAIRRNLFLSPLLAAELKPYDAIVFDPPRAGAEAQAREIAKSSAASVVGVSCNPKTFARDAAILREGGYVLQTVTPVDQFVYAAHVELVGVFAK